MPIGYILQFIRDHRDMVADSDVGLSQTKTDSWGYAGSRDNRTLQIIVELPGGSGWKKKDRGHRFCVDFTALNKITKPLAYSLPWIDNILVLLAGRTQTKPTGRKLRLPATLSCTNSAWPMRLACASRYLIQDDLSYYLSNREERVRPRLCVPKGLWCEVVNQCNDTSQYR